MNNEITKTMQDLIIRHHNDLGDIPLKGFTAGEIKIFWALCYKCQNRKSDELYFTFDEIRELANYKGGSKKQFIEALERTNKKLKSLGLRYEDEKVIEYFDFFSKYKIHKEENYLMVRVNPEFAYMINHFELGSFTKDKMDELKEIERIKDE